MSLKQKISNAIARWKKKRAYNRDMRKLVVIRKLLIEVVGNELPGNIIKHNDKDWVIQDVTVSLRKNKLAVERTLLKQTFTKRQRAAINWQIKQGLNKTHETV